MEEPTLTAIPVEAAAHKTSMPHATIALVPLDLSGRLADELPDLLTIAEVSTYLQVPVNTLYFWSANGTGPLAVKLWGAQFENVRFPEGVDCASNAID